MIIDVPFEIGDTMYVDSRTLPTDKLDYDEDEIPKFIKARIVSIRKNSHGLFVKLAVRENWVFDYIDNETGNDSSVYNTDKYFTYPASAFDKTIFTKIP